MGIGREGERVESVWLKRSDLFSRADALCHDTVSRDSETLGKQGEPMIALFYIGFLISIVAGIWLLVVAFKTSIWWGLGSLLLPFISLIFVFVHWQAAKSPFLWSLLGVALMVVPMLMQPGLLAVYDV